LVGVVTDGPSVSLIAITVGLAPLSGLARAFGGMVFGVAGNGLPLAARQ